MKPSSRLLGLAACLALSACASAPSKDGLPKSITIELKGKPGESTQTRYFSNARIQSIQNGQLLRDRKEAVEFTVRQRVLEYKPESKLIRYDLETVVKDGQTELHDLAFPELHEKLEYTVRSNGEVLRVSSMPPKSLFYVPSLPTPKGPVQIGDTWTMEHMWVSAKDGIPLNLEVLAILKDIVWCEGKRVCADIELSGEVSLVAAPTVAGAIFTSKLWGRLLFSLDRGDVIWSDMRSTENMGVQSDRMAVHSCMVSEMKIVDPSKIKFDCDPNDPQVTKTPVY